MTKKISVAMIIQDYHPMLGGAQRQIAALAPLLEARQVEVHVITRKYAGLKSFELVGGVPIHRLPIPGPKPIAAMSFILSCLPLIKRLNPHVIHAHELLSPVSAAIAAKRLFNIPVVAKVLRGGSLGDLSKLRRKPFGWQRIASTRKWVDMFITISREIDKELEEVDVPSTKRVFIPNGVEMDRFKPLSVSDKRNLRIRLDIPTNELVAVYSGRLSPEKRVDSLISIWPAVRREYPNAKLLILGTGGEMDRLKKIALDGIQFIGQIDNVVPYLQASDLFILPSSTEGLSNALLEAMACGLSAVATAVGGAPDVISHKENGWLIKPDNVGELFEAIKSLFFDVTLRDVLSERAHKTIQQRYSLQATADGLLRLYERFNQKKR